MDGLDAGGQKRHEKCGRFGLESLFFDETDVFLSLRLRSANLRFWRCRTMQNRFYTLLWNATDPNRSGA